MASGREIRRRAYTPALRFHALTGYFDALMAHSLKEARIRRLLLDQLDRVAGTGLRRGTTRRRRQKRA